MKKLFASLSLILVAALALTGCSGGESLVLETVWGKNFEETLNYDITFKAPETQSSTGASFTFNSGSYTATLKSVKEENNTTYELTTTTKVSGVYNFQGEMTPFDDKITTLVRFKGITQYSLFPTYSEKTVLSTGIVEQKSKYLLKKYDIFTQTEYDVDKKTAKVSLYSKNPQTSNYDLPVEQLDTVRNFKKLGKTSYFDNEMLLYAIRAMELKEGFTASFRTIDVMSQNLTEMGVSVPQKDALVGLDFNINSQDTTVNVLKVSIGISATMSGAGFLGYYAQSNDDTLGARRLMYMLESPMPYGLGTLVYKLNTINYSSQS